MPRIWRRTLTRIAAGLLVAPLVAALVAALVAGAPVASRTVVVRLEGNAFRPDQIHARAGDTLKFVNGNGGPHNVKFADDSIAAPVRALLEKAMGGEKIGPMSSPLFIDPGETYSFVIPGLPRGRYPLYCLPHQVNMRGALIVE